MLRWVAAPLAFLLILVAPTASAQFPPPEVTVTMEESTERLLPETGMFVSGIQITVTCTGEEVPQNPTIVRLRIKEQPLYASATLSQSDISQSYEPGTCQPGQEKAFQSTLAVTVSRDAPAMQDGRYIVEVTVRKSPNGPLYGPFTVTTTVKNDYLPLTAVNAPQLFLKAAPNTKVVFPVDVTNFGNGPTRVQIELTPMGKNRLASYEAGGELRLESKAGKAGAVNKVTRNIDVQTPDTSGYMNSVYSFTARFVSRYDGASEDELQIDETSVTFTVQVQGTGGGLAQSPAPSGWLLVMVLVGALAWRRRA